MSCKIQITTYDKADALVVPKKAVHDDKDDPDQHYVWLVDADDTEAKPERRTVKLGKRKDEDVEILKGLKKGDVISLDDEEAKKKPKRKKKRNSRPPALSLSKGRSRVRLAYCCSIRTPHKAVSSRSMERTMRHLSATKSWPVLALINRCRPRSRRSSRSRHAIRFQNRICRRGRCNQAASDTSSLHASDHRSQTEAQSTAQA